MVKRFLFVVLLLCLLATPAAASTMHAIWADTDDAYLAWGDGDEACPFAANFCEAVPGQTYNYVGIATFVGVPQAWRAYYAFDLSGLSGDVDSARVVLVVNSAGKSDTTPEGFGKLDFYGGDCCIASGVGSCLGDVACSDSSSCTTVLASGVSVPPVAGESIYVSVPVDHLTLGAGHSLDLRVQSTLETLVCNVAGTNYAGLGTMENLDVWRRPKLYVWIAEAAAGTTTVGRTSLSPYSAYRKHINNQDPQRLKLGRPGGFRKLRNES